MSPDKSIYYISSALQNIKQYIIKAKEDKIDNHTKSMFSPKHYMTDVREQLEDVFENVITLNNSSPKEYGAIFIFPHYGWQTSMQDCLFCQGPIISLSA